MWELALIRDQNVYTDLVLARMTKWPIVCPTSEKALYKVIYDSRIARESHMGCSTARTGGQR